MQIGYFDRYKYRIATTKETARAMSHHINVTRIKPFNNALGELMDKVVLLAGQLFHFMPIRHLKKLGQQRI